MVPRIGPALRICRLSLGPWYVSLDNMYMDAVGRSLNTQALGRAHSSSPPAIPAMAGSSATAPTEGSPSEAVVPFNSGSSFLNEEVGLRICRLSLGPALRICRLSLAPPLFMAPRWPKMAQDGPKMAPRWPKMAPRRPQDGLQPAQDGPKKAQDGPRWPQDDPRWPQNDPRWP